MNLSLSYLTMVIGILCAKCLGFVRESVVAGSFGASTLTDIYFQVFSVANVIFAAIGVSLSTLVVKSINTSNCENERGFIKLFLKKILAYAGSALILLAILGYPVTKLLLPGISGDEFFIALKLYYIMLPTFLFIVSAYTLNGILQNKGKFFITSILSVPFNIIIIGSLLLGVRNIYVFGAVTTVGWASQFLFLLPSFFRNVKDNGIPTESREVLKNTNMAELLFIFVSNLVFQLLFIIDKAFVSGSEGVTSAIHYSSYLFTTVSSIFLAGMSAVFFPSLTKSINEKNEEKTHSLIRYTLTFMFAVFVAYLMIAGFYHKNIISLLYERGSFTAEATTVTSKYFLIYSFCIFGYITQELLFKIFYAKGKYSVTVLSAGAVVLVNLICDFIFKENPFYVVLSTAVVCIIFAWVLFVILAKLHKGLFSKEFGMSVVKILIASLAFPVCFFVFKGFIGINKIMFAIPVCISAVLYLAVLWKTGIVKEILFKKF